MSRTVPPVLSVVPSRALVDEKFRVVVENLPPGAPVTLRSLHHSEDKHCWEAHGHYISDQRGIVSVADDISHGGTYRGIEAIFDLTFDSQVAKIMRAAGKEHLLTRLDYPDAGHLIEPPYSPHFRATKFKSRPHRK